MPAELTSPSQTSKNLSPALLTTLAYVLFCGLSLIPFIAVAHPPIVDFANHAARLTLACHRESAAISAMYSYRLGIIPNLAVDLVNFPLCGRIAPDLVLKLVTIASLVLIYFSAWLIQARLFGAPNAFLFVLPAMAFNTVTTMGYINFLAGIAIVMLMIALMARREQSFGAQILFGNLAGLIIFFCHVFALAVALLVFFGLMLGRDRIKLPAIIDAAWRTTACFGLPLALIALVPSDGHFMVIGFEGKLRGLVSLFMAQQDSVGLYGFFLAIPLAMLLRNRVVSIHPWFVAPLVILSIYVLLVPNQISDAVDVDSRSLVALAYLFFAVLQPLRRVREISLGLAAIASLYLALQLWTAATVWQGFSRQVDEFRSSLAILPAEARVFPVTDGRVGPRLVALPMSYAHMTSYATMDRQIFNPLEFTGAGMQPLSALPPFDKIDTPAGQPFTGEAAKKLVTPSALTLSRAREYHFEYALRWPANYDYVIYYHFGLAPNFDPERLQVLRRGSFFSILKIKRAVEPANSPAGRA